MAAIQDLVDRHAGGLRAAYEQLLLGMQGAWVGFTAGMDSPVAARVRLARQLTDLVGATSGLLRQAARQAVAEAHYRAQQEAGGSFLSEPEQALLEEAEAIIETAAARDARGLNTLALQTLTRYSLAKQRMHPTMARATALGELPGQGRDVFVQLDRLQRKRNSADYVTAALRMTMFAAYFQAWAGAAAAAGQEQVLATHPEHGEQPIDLLRGWTAWVVENTHPNTRWSLTGKTAP